MPPKLTTDGYIGLAKQAAIDGPVAPVAGLYIKYLSESLVNEQEDIKGVEGGSGRYMIESYKSTHKVTGDVSFYARPDVLGFLIGMFMGGDTFTAKAVGVTPSNHVFGVPVIPHFFTIARGVDAATPTLIERFQDCVVESLTIEGESSQPLKCTASIIGTKGVKQAAADTPTYEDNDPLMYFDTPIFTTDIGVTVEISKFSIKMSNNFDVWFGPGMTPKEMIEKLFTIDVNYTLKFLTSADYVKVYYGAAGGLTITDTIADGSFQASFEYGLLDLKRSLDINIKHLKRNPAPVNLDGAAAPIFQECVGYAVKVGADNLTDIVVKNSYDTDYDT